MIFKFTYKILGGHTHVTVRAGVNDYGMGLCGSLAFRNEEFNQFKELVERSESDVARPIFVEEP